MYGQHSSTLCKRVWSFLARLHFSAEELHCIAIPPASASVSASASASASACKMLGQMLKSWNFSLSVFFLAF